LQTYLQEYMGEFLFDDSQHFYFSTSDGFDYDLPDLGNITTYKNKVESLPLVNGPSVFGLHPNAEIQYFDNATRRMWADLMELQPRTAGGAGGGASREEYITSVASDVAAVVPEKTDVVALKKQLHPPLPTQTVLCQELERWNKLVSIMAVSLRDLKRALVGEIGMSDDLDKLSDALFNGQLPAMWMRWAPQSDKGLGGWIEHFRKRVQQYTDWIDDDEPLVVWMAGFQIPDAYLAAIVQMTCRAKGWPLDKSTLFTKTTTMRENSEVKEALDYGCYVCGLYLEGAGWDYEKATLKTQDPKVLVVDLPITQVIPVEMARLKLKGTFKTPVYVTQQRKNAMGVGLVFEADLATSEHLSHWILQGVALMLNVQ